MNSSALAHKSSPLNNEERDTFEDCYIPRTLPPDDQIRRYISRQERIPQIARPYRPREGECAWRSQDEYLSPGRSEYSSMDKKVAEGEATYLSFGDNGTTATVTELGQLMQMSRYLGPGRSSIFVVDNGDTEEPYLISIRAEDLQRMTRHFTGFGLDVITPGDDFKRSTSFLRNQWPRVSVSGPEWDGYLQWLIHDGVTMVQYVLRNNSKDEIEFKCIFNTDVLIRDLDFIDPSYGFNEESSDGEYYRTSKGPGGYGLLKVHKLLPPKKPKNRSSGRTWYQSDTDQEEASIEKDQCHLSPEAVSLVTGFFVDGKAEKWEDLDAMKDIKIGPGKSTEITAGFKLVLLTSEDTDWKPLIVSADEVDIDRILAETSSPYFKDDGLDYPTRRNIEHILSVCSIPVTLSNVWDYQNIKVAAKKGAEDSLVAFTCGDMAGHRVCTSASFFAFKFLITMSKHLRNCTQNEDSMHLRTRIHETCKAHLRWLFKRVEMKDRYFSCNYWVNGRMIELTDELPSACPADTPYQILKAFDYYEHFDSDEERKFVTELLRGCSDDSAMAWVEKLNQENKRNSYVWRHSPTTDIGTFRLDDHVWICYALKALSVIFDWEGQSRNMKKPSSTPNDSEKKSEERNLADLRRKYEPGNVQREITRRFTTVNEDSKLRMLAVTRSARENRFLLHSRDTALFYSPDGRLLTLDNDVWKSMLDSQRYQEANQDLIFDNPLRYALAMVMASNGFSINRSEPGHVFETAKSALLGSMLANGIFPGQIDEITKEEKLFNDKYYRDFYFHVSFEVPYVLWEFKSKDNSTAGQRPRANVQELYQRGRQSSNLLSELSPMSPVSPMSPMPPIERSDTGIKIEIGEGKGGTAIVTATRENLRLKGKIPFSNSIDSQNIVDVPEEWLYDYPSFLDFEPPATTLSWEEVRAQFENDDYCEVIQNGFKECTKRTDDSTIPFAPNSPWNPLNFVLDIGKKRKHGKTSTETITSPERVGFEDFNLWDKLSRRRTAETSKKRFVALKGATVDCALMCWLSSHEAEKDSISLFFDHHANCEKYFFDEAVRVQNSWETEFHTSFLQLADGNEMKESSEKPIHQPKPVDLPKLANRRLVLASMGFRLFGDFLDRFWTCHFIEFVPHRTANNDPREEDIQPFVNRHWRQRKILELVLYNRMLGEMNRSTGEILTVIKGKLGVETGRLSLANLRSERYFKTSIEWEAYGQILEAVEIHLGSIMVHISDWENRERDRQQERPRWTKGDERKYRREINKNLVLCRRKTQELKGHQATVRSLRASLTTTQERIRNELGLRGNENIRYFTYVTVIFLPLGFAASIFSMQAAPPHQTLRQMIVVAVVGIMVTILVLVAIQSVFSLLEESVDKLTARGKRLVDRFHGSDKEENAETDEKKRSSETEPKYDSLDDV